ncbi:hypothetical protein [Cytobacillus sp. BC1816]|uniref:hypothetical protein n=1 Tax=Cytobacillus sp. BC1816 TaxID=3440154 RepID=UPI003F5133C5
MKTRTRQSNWGLIKGNNDENSEPAVKLGLIKGNNDENSEPVKKMGVNQRE